MTRSAPCAEFIDSPHGPLFALARHPVPFSGRSTLVVPPFAEEMNKCRPILSRLAQKLAALDRGLILVDLLGTGDSAGEFGDATCEIWIGNLIEAIQWANVKGWQIDSLLAIRTGALLALDLADQHPLPAVRQTVLWQPALDGARALDQFLRLRVAASMSTGQKETVADIKARLAAGETVDVAGYELTPKLAQGLGGLRIPDSVSKALGDVTWMEVIRPSLNQLPTTSANALDSLRGAGIAVNVTAIHGEPYWISVETVLNEALVNQTAARLASVAL